MTAENSLRQACEAAAKEWIPNPPDVGEYEKLAESCKNLADTIERHLAPVVQSLVCGAYAACARTANNIPFRAHSESDVDFHSGCAQTRDAIVIALRALTPSDAAKELERRDATIESLNRDLVGMVAYRHALRQVTEQLLKYAEDTYPRCPEDSARELEEADRRSELINGAKRILYDTAVTDLSKQPVEGSGE